MDTIPCKFSDVALFLWMETAFWKDGDQNDPVTLTTNQEVGKTTILRWLKKLKVVYQDPAIIRHSTQVDNKVKKSKLGTILLGKKWSAKSKVCISESCCCVGTIKTDGVGPKVQKHEVTKVDHLCKKSKDRIMLQSAQKS
jgi:hypothetical protein